MGFLGKLIVGFLGFFVILYAVLKLAELPKYMRDKERAERVADRLIPYMKKNLPQDYILSYIEIDGRFSVHVRGFSGGLSKDLYVTTKGDLGFDTSNLPTYNYYYPEQLAKQVIERYPLPNFVYKSSKELVHSKSSTEFIVRGPEDSTAVNPILGYTVEPVVTGGNVYHHYILPRGMNPKDLGKIGKPVSKKEDIL